MRNTGHDRSGVPRDISRSGDRLVYIPYSCDEIDRVVLSQLEETPEMREELLRYLRRAIRENRYSIPEERVAEGMIQRCHASRLN